MKRWLGIAVVLLGVSPIANAYTEVREEAIFTEDGIRLSAKHYVLDGAQPVVMFHGIMANIFSIDLQMPGLSLAEHIANAGYDVWVVNLRGHGKEGYMSGDGGTWVRTVDQFALLDVEAAILHVLDTTGQRPLIGAHSMGGMALYMWLQGTSFVQDSQGRARVYASTELARVRNEEIIRGLFTVASPARVRWKHMVSPLNALFYDYYDYNLLLTSLGNNSVLEEMLRNIEYLPQGSIVDWLTDDLRNTPYLGDGLADFLMWIVSNISDSFLVSQIFNPAHMTPEIIAMALDTAIDDTSSTILLQFIDWMRTNSVREYITDDPAWPSYVYSDHYDQITAPMLVIAGDKDKLANDDVIYEEGFKKFGSSDKSYFLAENYGHGDIILGEGAAEEVWPVVVDFLDLHSGASNTARISN